MVKNYLSIDIGGTNVKYGLLDRAGHIIERHRIKTPTDDLTSFQQAIRAIIQSYRGVIRGIAFSVPGRVDTKTGTVYHGGSLPFLDGVNFRSLFETEDQIPIAVENDGKSAALAELWLGNLQNIHSGVAIVLGTGVGGGIIIDGKLHYGTHLQAGEFSFISEDYQQDSYMNGAVGFTLSAVNMIQTIGKTLQLENPQDGRLIFDYINRHDPLAWPIFQQYCDHLAKLVLSLQAVLDVDRYVIGGGISAQPIVTQTLRTSMDQLLQNNPLIKDSLEPIDIQPAKFANDANLFGALYSFLVQVDEGDIEVAVS